MATLYRLHLRDAMERDIPLGIWLGQHYSVLFSVHLPIRNLVLSLSVSSVVSRHCFLSAVYFFRSDCLSTGHGFYQHIVLLVLLLLFINHERWQTLWIDRRSSFTLGSARPPAAQWRRDPAFPARVTLAQLLAYHYPTGLSFFGCSELTLAKYFQASKFGGYLFPSFARSAYIWNCKTRTPLLPAGFCLR